MNADASHPDLLLPPGATLLHIGPHKTGTTMIQQALAAQRPALRESGVLYPGSKVSHTRAAWDLTGYENKLGLPQARADDWSSLVEEVRAWTAGRVVISSEFFDMADDAAAIRAVRDLGDDTHVVVTLRAFAAVLPSSWQQAVAAGMEIGYDDWLHDLFDKPEVRRSTRMFWQRHRYDELIARWMAASDGRLTVVIRQGSERSLISHTFEQLLGLPPELLAPIPGETNRSLSHPETELVRRLSPMFRDRGLTREDYGRIVNKGLVPALKTSRMPHADEARIATPPWARERAVELGAQMATSIAALSPAVVGDLATLSDLPRTTVRDPDGSEMNVDLAAEVVMAALVTGSRKRIAKPAAHAEALSARELARELWSRVRDRATPAGR